MLFSYLANPEGSITALELSTNKEWCYYLNTISKIHTIKWTCGKSCCTLNGLNDPQKKNRLIQIQVFTSQALRTNCIGCGWKSCLCLCDAKSLNPLGIESQRQWPLLVVEQTGSLLLIDPTGHGWSSMTCWVNEKQLKSETVTAPWGWKGETHVAAHSAMGEVRFCVLALVSYRK